MQMYYKKDNCLVEVYHFFESAHCATALIFSPSMAGSCGNGWMKVKLSQLVPKEYYDEHSQNFMSKTKKNKIKERLTLTHATWTCTDGIDFENCEEAIQHERELMETEKEAEEND